MTHQILILLFILLLLSVAAWVIIYRHYDHEGPFFIKARQILVPIITLLVCVVVLVIMYSSDPGNIDGGLFGP